MDRNSEGMKKKNQRGKKKRRLVQFGCVLSFWNGEAQSFSSGEKLLTVLFHLRLHQ